MSGLSGQALAYCALAGAVLCGGPSQAPWRSPRRSGDGLGRGHSAGLDNRVAAPGVDRAASDADRASPGAGRSPPGDGVAGSRWLRLAAPAVAGLTVAIALGGLLGLASGAGCAAAVVTTLRRAESATQRVRHETLLADLPLALDLVAVTLRAGLPLATSTAVVADALGGLLGAQLDGVAREVALGAPPGQAWDRLAVLLPGSAVVARAVGRSADSGAVLAEVLSRSAEETRGATRALAEEAARAAAVQVAAPLGLCFLPAFVCVGVVPVVVGVAGRLAG